MALGNQTVAGSHVLFIVCSTSIDWLEDEQMQSILHRLKSYSVKITSLLWNDPLLLDIQYLTSTYTHITFFASDGYFKDITKFRDIVLKGVMAAIRSSSKLQVLNDPAFVLWNSDKTYLLDLFAARFSVSPLLTLPASSTKERILTALSVFPEGKSVVLKPSITAGGHSTHLICDAANLKTGDVGFIETFIGSSRGDSLIVQDFEPEVANGELMVMYINGHITHAILKTPVKGGFLTSARDGADRKQVRVQDLPEVVVKTVESLIAWLEKRFSMILKYARIDGIVRKDGKFILMEIEGIEPGMFFHRSTPENDEPDKGLSEFVQLFCKV